MSTLIESSVCGGYLAPHLLSPCPAVELLTYPIKRKASCPRTITPVWGLARICYVKKPWWAPVNCRRLDEYLIKTHSLMCGRPTSKSTLLYTKDKEFPLLTCMSRLPPPRLNVSWLLLDLSRSENLDQPPPSLTQKQIQYSFYSSSPLHPHSSLHISFHTTTNCALHPPSSLHPRSFVHPLFPTNLHPPLTLHSLRLFLLRFALNCETLLSHTQRSTTFWILFIKLVQYPRRVSRWPQHVFSMLPFCRGLHVPPKRALKQCFQRSFWSP